MFGKRAEVIQKYFSKGKPIIIEGRLRLETWEKDGQKHSKHVIMVDSFHFLPNAQRQEPPQSQPQYQEPTADEIPF
jgi:single-strand DNA-binding protein